MRIAALLVTVGLAAGVGAGTTSPPPVQLTLTRVLAHAESASMYRDRVNWSKTRAEVQRLADTATTIPGLGPALRYLLRTLGDEHGRVMHGGRPIAYYFGAPKPHLAGFDRDCNNRIQSASAFPFRAAMTGRAAGGLARWLRQMLSDRFGGLERRRRPARPSNR